MNYEQRLMTFYRRQGSRPSPRGEKKCIKAKWLPEEALQITVKREVKSKEEKEKIYLFECRLPNNSKER